ncbi:hypothetical protein Ga0074115_102165 [endosymbiont of Ridgeia piscesae]|jgi:hypothetical protein|uniref:Uncharacterized protein n=1 Tax=endosymbiont of Ridgeia piscesae TaxID=54398 RepID=A0A0T5Z7W7_9GAMM|nr:hypothetical protein Ga0074115_102165 [endosymbiont of Ridgeia piscesae]KRT58936.1 hypothetical protein Ga0076813_14545 [endosymbiont of Ridgeia piscesae]
MWTHLLALLGLAALCGSWIIFQDWLKRQDPSYRGYKAGCGACGNGACESEQGSCSPPATQIKLPPRK